jgi:MFS family permease
MKPSLYRAFKMPDVKRLLIASACTAAARGIFLGALPLAVAKDGGGPLAIGLVSGSLTIWWLFSVPLSEFLDRYGIGPMLRLVAGLRILGALPLVVAVTLHGSTVIAFTIFGALIYGLFDCLASTGERSIPALIVEPEMQDDAFSLLSVANGVPAFVIGPSVGALLLVTDKWLPFLSASAGLTIAYLVYRPFYGDVRLRARRDAAASKGGWFKSAFRGIEHIRQDSVLRSVVITLLGVAIAEELVLVVITPYFQHGSGLSNWPVVLGVLRSVAGGASLVGGLLAASLARRFGRWRVLCAIGLCGALGPAVLATSALWGTVLLALLISSLAESIWVPLVQSETAMRTPPELMARTRAAMMFVTWGTLPVVSIAGGGIAEAVGIRPVLVFGSIAALTACVLGVWRSLGRSDSEHQVNSVVLDAVSDRSGE